MIILRYRFNCLLTALPEFGAIKHPVVPVLLRDGDFRRVEWGGFVDLDEIKKRYDQSVKPVKLDIVDYSVSPGEWAIWRRVPDGMAVQGAIINGKALCVIENGAPRLVDRTPSGLSVPEPTPHSPDGKAASDAEPYPQHANL